MSDPQHVQPAELVSVDPDLLSQLARAIDDVEQAPVMEVRERAVAALRAQYQLLCQFSREVALLHEIAAKSRRELGDVTSDEMGG